MCKAAPKSVSGAPCQPMPAIDTTSHWSKGPPTTGVSLEEFAEKVGKVVERGKLFSDSTARDVL